MNQELIDLTKKVDVVLDLRKITNVKAAVCLGIDGSGSMRTLYNNGTVQKTVNRISAVAVKFDDNQELDVLAFSRGVNEAKPATPAMFGNYVQKELLDKRLIEFGDTNFAPMITQIRDNYFSGSPSTASAGSILGAFKNVLGFGSTETSKPSKGSAMSDCGFPVFAIIITDGDNSDPTKTTKLLKEMQSKDIYWQFVGIGNDTTFSYCKKVADDLPNVGFFHIPNLENMKDMELYKLLLNEEFTEWVKKF